MGFLAGLNEDDEHEGDEDGLPVAGHDHDQPVQQQRSLMDQGKENLVGGVGAGYPAPVNANVPKERERQHKRGGRRIFELQMDNATLLGRRQNAQQGHAVNVFR
jgi:hypothetical protein